MKKTRKILSVFLLFVLVVNAVFCFPAIASAGDKPTIYADDIEAGAGENISVPILLKNNTGIAGFSLEFSYDSSILTPLSVTYGNIVQSGLDDNLEGDAVPGKFKAIWYSSENLVANGILMYLNFKVSDDVYNGNTNIEISYSQEDTFDENFNDVVLDCKSVNLTIIATSHNTWYYSKLLPDAQTVKTGETLIIEEKVLSAEGSPTASKTVLTYDKNSFEFIGFANSEKQIVSPASANGTVTILNNNGEYSCEECPEVEIASAPKYYAFKAKGNAQSNACEFEFEMICNSFEDISTTGCTVNIQKGEDYSIDINNYSAIKDDILTVSVPICNNKGLMGYMLNFEYNPNHLQPIAATRGTLFSGNFDDSIGVESGKFAVLWSNSENNYSDGELFTVTFRVLTDSTILSTVNVSYSQDDTFDENYNDVVLACQDFQVMLNHTEHQYELLDGSYAPTCTESGYAFYRCVYCGDEYSESIAALGHKWGNWAVTKAASCTEDGIETRVCSNDDSHTETRSITKLGHAPAEAVRENEVEATYQQEGSYDEVVYCSRCGVELSRESKTTPVLQRFVTGMCGANVEYTLDLATGLLTISGSGKMYNYNSNNAPFKDYPTITEIVIQQGITSIGESIFASCKNVESITIPKSITIIGESALIDSNNLTDVYYGGTQEQWEHLDIRDLNHPLEDATIHSTPMSIRFEPKHPVKVLYDSAMPYFWVGVFAQGNVLTVINGEDEERFVAQFVDELDDYAFVSETTGEIITERDDELNVILYGVYDYESGEPKVTIHYKEAYVEVPAVVEEWEGYSCQTLLNGEQTDNIEYDSLYNKNITFTYTGDDQLLSWDFGDAIEGYDYRLIAQGEKSVTIRFAPTTQNLTINAMAHKHQYTTVVTEPTCIQQGYSTYTCSLCGDSYVADYIPALGHTPAEAVRENEVGATCTKTGSYDEVIYCSVCHLELSREQKEVAKCEHSYSSDKTDSTCTHMGYTTYTCSVCGFSYVGDFVALKDHVYREFVTEPTTESKGYTVHICENCGYAYVDSITDVLPSEMNYIIPAWDQISTTLIAKSDENEYSVDSSSGIFKIENIKSDTYRLYAKQKNSVVICIGEYDTKSGEVVNNEDIIVPIGDVNSDDVIDVTDVSQLLLSNVYGEENDDKDLNGDKMIDISDLSIILSTQNYGKTSVSID